MRIPYKAPRPIFNSQQIAKDILQNQYKRALMVKQLRIKRGYTYQFVADACEQVWFGGTADWLMNYRNIGEAICREAAKQLNEPFEYPWSD